MRTAVVLQDRNINQTHLGNFFHDYSVIAATQRLHGVAVAARGKVPGRKKTVYNVPAAASRTSRWVITR